MTRLPYETKGGAFSEGEAFAQGIEYLRLAAEAFYAIGHHNNSYNNSVRGDGFVKVGQMLELVRERVTKFATTGRMQ
jgi:hypothetical protein